MISNLIVVVVMAAIAYKLGLMLHGILKENEEQTVRITELSSMLQIAEYQTGYQYYSSLGTRHHTCEQPDWLYEAMREKLIISRNISGPRTENSNKVPTSFNAYDEHIDTDDATATAPTTTAAATSNSGDSSSTNGNTST